MIFPLNSLAAICFDLSSDWLLVLSTSRVIRSGSCFIFGNKLQFFSRVSKKRHPGKRHFTFLSKRASTVIYIEEG